jgi:hypothetical protein
MNIQPQILWVYHGLSIACIAIVAATFFRPILQPVVYLDEKCEKILLGPTTRSRSLATEWGQHTSANNPGSSYMILKNLHWDRQFDIVFCDDKFR